eukprot:scaffold520169_cov33-Prasinocladus_malaysianus.AAC.1
MSQLRDTAGWDERLARLFLPEPDSEMTTTDACRVANARKASLNLHDPTELLIRCMANSVS